MFGGLRKKLNDVWSGADFWDEKENRAQRVQAARPAQAVKAPPIQTVSRQNAPQAPASIRRISQPQPQQRTTNQLIDKSYGDGVTGMFNKYVRDTFDANTEADKIRRQANTGLSETYKQEQARKTASAVNTKQGRNTLNQFASGGLAGAADFFGKAPGSAMQVQGRVSKAINSIDNPIVRTGVKLVAAPQTLFQGEKEANKQLEAGKQLSSLVENKKQQSGIGNRRDDNRLAYGAGQVTTQLPAQIATGGLGLANTGLQTTADEANRAQAKGKSNNQALGIGALQGSVSAASEKFGIDKFVPGSGTSSRLVNAGKRVLTEGGQEAQQQFTQNLIANKTYDPNQSLKEGVAESAVLGGLAGGVMSPVADFKAPKRPTTNLVSKPTRTRLRPEEARIWSDYQETLYKGNRMPAQVVNETHNKARQIADSLGVDIITGSPDEIAGRMNPLLEQSMAFQKEPTTSLVSRAKGMITPLNQGGYIQLGAPEPKKLSQDIKDQFSKQGSFGRDAMDRLEANKISKGDLERAGVIFDPKQVKKIAQTLPEFKDNPVMTYRKGDYRYMSDNGRYRSTPDVAESGTFEFKHKDGVMRLNPEALFGKEMAQKLAQTAKDGEQVDFTDTMKASGNRLFTYDQTADIPTPTVAKPVQKQVTEKQNSVDPLESLNQEARKFETLPEDIHPSLEAKAVGVKRIAPDRVPHQQLTVKEGIEKLVEADKNIAAKRAEGWLKVASDTDTLIKKYGDTIPARTKSNLEKYPDLQKDFATYDYLKRNTYGSVKTLSGMKEQFTSNSSRVGWNDAKEAATRASVDKKYRELVKKDISKGYRYPDEVLNYDKSFKTATDNRARYEKGLATSFSSDDSRIVFDDQKRIAGGMKRQDGKELTSDQKEEMVNGILQTQKHLGVDIDSLAKNNRWVFAHLNGKNPFLTKNAAGLYRGGKDHASVSVGGTETFNTVIDGKKVTKRVNTTMAHELGHALDLQGDKRLLDRDSLWQLRNKYNSVEGGFRGSKYWNSEAEMTARAIAQYVQVAEGSPSAYSKPGNWNKELFDQYIKPSVEKGLKEKYPDYQISKATQPPKSTFEQNLEQAGVKPKNGLVLSERKNLDGTITQKVRTGKGQVEERVVRDTQLSKLEKQKRQIVDAEARPIYDNDKQRAQKQKDLRKQIIAKGGIGSSDYETFPKSLKRKGGQSLDEIATELGFNSDEELMKELDSYKQPQKLDDIREVVQDELANGNKELSGDYARLLQQIDDRKAELLRYPNGSRVTKNRQNFPTEDEFMNLMSSAEASDPNNKTKSAVSTATRDIKSEQRQAVLEGDLQKAQQLRQQVGQIETGLERKAPDLSQNVDETIKEAPQIRSIKDKSVKQAFEVLTKQYLGTKNATKIERDVTIKNLESKYKLNDAEKLNAILAGDSATVKPMNQKVADYLREFRNNTDTAYKRYTEAGEKMGYVSSYLPRIYKNPQTGQLLDATEFELLQRASARTRGREADVVATDWLVEKDPTKLLERYYQSMDNAVAGKNYLKQLQNSGIVTASSEPVRGLRPIVAEGMQSDDGMIYYAPKDVATKLNNLFGANEANNLVEKALEKGSGLNSLFQSFVLSGGIPNTPINSFGMMQVMKEGMALHPVKAGKAITAGFSKRYADKVFTAKKDYLKMMAANDIDIRVDLTQTGKSGTRRTIEAFKEGKAKGLNQAWNEFTNDSTFSRFMPMLEVTHFENIYKKAIRKNTPERAAQIAAESVKNFYGKTGNYKPAVRGKVVDDFYGAAFFAPRFRESMINFWGKNIKALNPKNYGKLEYRDNQKFLVASALTYTAMTLLNEALNGVQMWDNPDDKKDKLILPADKLKEFGINTEGKDIGIPFLSSIATVPRNAVSGLASLASGDLQSAGKRAKSFLSMPLNSAGDLITNEDYFGNQIVKDDVKGLDRFSQMASYTAGRNMQPWLREGLNKAGGGLSDDLKKKLGIKEKGSFETFSNALESPLRFYDPKYYRYSEQWAPRGGKNEKFDFAEQRARSGVKKQIDSIPGELGLSNTQKAAFKALNTYNFDSDGNLKLDNDPFYQAKRATALQDDGVFEAMKKRAQLENKLNGKPIDPLYSLPPSARRIILWKKTLPQGTSDPTIKQIYGQEWYQDYRGQEAKYFADKRVYNKKMGYKDSSGTDTNPYPDASPQVAQKLDYYYTLPSGTGARSRFLEANPDVLAQWDAVENWKNGERAQVGLGEIGDDNKYAYGKSSGGKGGRKGKGRGGRGGRGGKASSKYDYTKDLFGSGGNIDSNNNTKALRAILAKAMSGKS